MLQPFELFKTSYISRLRNLKRTFLVSQTYGRIADGVIGVSKTPLLLTDYDNLGQARIHKNAVKGDRLSAILDLENSFHRNKMEEMLMDNSRYIIYWAVVKDSAVLRKMVNQKYKDNMRRYLEKSTNWRINRDTTINPVVEVTFGELFITLKHSGQQIRLKFEDIEKS